MSKVTTHVLFTKLTGKVSKTDDAYFSTRKADGQIFLHACKNPSKADGQQQQIYQLVFQKIRAMVPNYIATTTDLQKRFDAQKGRRNRFLRIETMAFSELWKANRATLYVQAAQELAEQQKAEKQAKKDAADAMAAALRILNDADASSTGGGSNTDPNSSNGSNTDSNGSNGSNSNDGSTNNSSN